VQSLCLPVPPARLEYRFTTTKMRTWFSYEAAASALGALRYESDKPRLRKMIAARIEELNALDEDEVEGNPLPHRQSIVSLLHFNS